jgi:hypothetical protein
MVNATFDSVIASRKLSLAFVVLALLSLCASLKAKANFTVWVNRRSTTDLYSLDSETTIDNCDAKPNYLVNEKRCALDEELFYGMYYSIAIKMVISDTINTYCRM